MPLDESARRAILEAAGRAFPAAGPAAGSRVMCGSQVCFARGNMVVALMAKEGSFRVGKTAAKALAGSAGVPVPTNAPDWLKVPVATLVSPRSGVALVSKLVNACAAFSKTLPLKELKPQATTIGGTAGTTGPKTKRARAKAAPKTKAAAKRSHPK